MIDTDAIGRVTAQFELAASVQAITAFGDGLINETYLVTTGAGDYVLQRINQAVFTDPARVMENIATVSRHLGGRFVPELVTARAGGFIVSDGPDAWRAWHRVIDAEPAPAVTPARAATAATLLGRFHAGLADLEPDVVAETLPRFHDPARRLTRLHEAVAADAHGRARGVEAEIAAAIAAAPLAQVAGDLVARVPRRVAHNDAQLSNVVFRGDEAVCLVDLDTVMPTASFWDVGDLVRSAATYAPEDDPQPERAVVDAGLLTCILDGYRAGRATGPAPTRAEDDALELAGAIVIYEQALRFLTDWIAGDVYYRTTRAGQNRDRARAQLALLASMPGTVAS